LRIPAAEVLGNFEGVLLYIVETAGRLANSSPTGEVAGRRPDGGAGGGATDAGGVGPSTVLRTVPLPLLSWGRIVEVNLSSVTS
jgi:hypothetical protein